MFKFAAVSQSVLEVLFDSLKLYKITVLSVLPLSALALFIGSIPGLVGVRLPVVDILNKPQLFQGAKLFSMLFSLLFFIVILFLTLSVLAVLIDSMHRLALGKTCQWQDSFVFVRQKLPAIFTAYLANTVIIVLAFALFFFLGLFVSILSLFCILCILLENKSGFSSIQRSWSLVWGNWWISFFVILLPSLVGLLLMSFVLSLAQGSQWLMVLMDVATMSFILPFFYAVLFVQFNNLQVRYLLKSQKVSL